MSSQKSAFAIGAAVALAAGAAALIAQRLRADRASSPWAPIPAPVYEPQRSYDEPGEFSARLDVVGVNKIPVIMVVRELTGLGLKEGKDLVDAVPQIIRAGISKDSAETIKAALEEQGAQVSIF